MKIGNAPAARTQPWAVDWQGVADTLRRHPEEDVLLDEFNLEDTPRLRGMYVSVRAGEIGKLAELGGVVVPMARNSRIMEGNRKRGDLWLRWVPDADPREFYSDRAIRRGVAAGRYPADWSK